MRSEDGFNVDSIMAQSSEENFPVTMRVLPRRFRRHLLAVYGFARFVDNLGDEYTGDRLAALDWVEAELARSRSGTATHPLMVSLGRTLAELELSDEPFHNLIQANRLDQRRPRTATQEELAEYCVLSANPVGRLVLAVFGADIPERVRLSDAVCTGLQIVEHLQDIGEDCRRGRVYMPAEQLERFGVTDEDLHADTASLGLRRLVAHQCGHARSLLTRGDALVASLKGWARLTVAGYVAGGRATVDAIRRADYEVLGGLRKRRRARTIQHTVRLLTHREKYPLVTR